MKGWMNKLMKEWITFGDSSADIKVDSEVPDPGDPSSVVVDEDEEGAGEEEGGGEVDDGEEEGGGEGETLINSWKLFIKRRYV